MMIPNRPYTVIPSEVGPLLVTIRGRHGLSIRKAAKALGTNYSNLNRAEREPEKHLAYALDILNRYKSVFDNVIKIEDPKTKIALPHYMDDLVDEVREPERSVRRSNARKIFQSHGCTVLNTGHPNQVEAHIHGSRITVYVDELKVFVRPSSGNAVILSVGSRGRTEDETYARAVRIATDRSPDKLTAST